MTSQAETYKQLGIELGPELEAEYGNSPMPEVVRPVDRKAALQASREVLAPVSSDLAKQLDALDTNSGEVESALSGERQASQESDVDGSNDLSWLDLPEDLGLAETKDVPEVPDTPEAKKFAEDFKQYLGFDISELRTGVQAFKAMQDEIAKVRAERTANQAVKDLKATWGVDGTEFDNRIKQVTERHGKYKANKALYDQLDNIEGAKLIWAKIEQEGKAKKPEVPQFDRSSKNTSPVSSTEKGTITWAQIESLSDSEYQRLLPKINKMMLEGKIK